jgi:hypothetical protein
MFDKVMSPVSICFCNPEIRQNNDSTSEGLPNQFYDDSRKLWTVSCLVMAESLFFFGVNNC